MKLRETAIKYTFEKSITNFIPEELELFQEAQVYNVSESEKKLLRKHIHLANKYDEDITFKDEFLNKIKILYKVDMEGRRFSYADDGYVVVFPEGMFMMHRRPTFGVIQFWEVSWGMVVQFTIGFSGATEGKLQISYKFKEVK